MITLTTEQAQQIEEALMKIADLRNLGKIQPEVIAFETLYIIRAARAQEQAEQEPVAWMWRMHGWSTTAHGKHRAIKKYVDVCKPPVETQASGDFIDLTPLCATPVQQVDQMDEQWTQSELFKLAVSRGLITLHTEFVAAPVAKTKVSWMEGRATSCDISNEAARAVIAADREKNK